MSANLPKYGDRITVNDHATLEFHVFLEDLTNTLGGGGGGTPGGSDSQIQYNNGGVLGGMAWSYNDISQRVTGTSLQLNEFFMSGDTADDNDPLLRLVEDITNSDHDWYLVRGAQYVGGQWQLAKANVSPAGVFFNGDATNNGIAVLAAGNHDSAVAGTNISRPEDWSPGAAVRVTGLSGNVDFDTNGVNRARISDTETQVDDLRVSNITKAAEFAASTTVRASANIAHGTAPTTPNDGDFWSTTAGFFGQVNGSTVPLGGSSSGSRALISETSITAVSSITITWDETVYNKVELVIEDMQVGTDAVDLMVRFGHTNGATIISSANYGAVYNSGGSTWTNNTGQTEIRITNGAIGNAAGEYVQGEIIIKNFTSSNNSASLESRLNYHNTLTNILDVRTDGRLLSDANAFDAVQLFPSSGNFAAGGTIRLYGYRI